MVNLYIFCSCLGVFLFWRRSGVFFYRLGIGLGFYFGGSILDFDLYRIYRILFCKDIEINSEGIYFVVVLFLFW